MSSKENISAKDIFNVFPLDFQNNTWVTFILCYEQDKIKEKYELRVRRADNSLSQFYSTYGLEVPTPPTNNKLATLAQEWPAHSSPLNIIQRD